MFGSIIVGRPHNVNQIYTFRHLEHNKSESLISIFSSLFEILFVQVGSSGIQFNSIQFKNYLLPYSYTIHIEQNKSYN